MKWPSFANIISGSAVGFRASASRVALHAMSCVHAAGSTLFHLAFDSGLRAVHSARVPVISVGNLTAGGTGKTPFVALIANWLRHHGCAPCLVSRGYRATESGENDEKLVLDLQCPGIPHVQNRDRVLACEAAARDHSAEVIVLDDGFQHRRLKRNLDIVLVDCLNPWGFGYQLPRGLLRESKSHLSRAQLVALTRVDQVTAEALEKLDAEVRRLSPDSPVIHVRYLPSHWRNSDGETRELDSFVSSKALAFCGLGNPEGFFRTLDSMDIDVAGRETFPDHFHYDEAALETLSSSADRADCQVLLTTSKDLVKIPEVQINGRELWALEIEADITQGRDQLEQSLSQIIDRLQTDRPEESAL